MPCERAAATLAIRHADGVSGRPEQKARGRLHLGQEDRGDAAPEEIDGGALG
jgi:hypothetical protein